MKTITIAGSTQPMARRVASSTSTIMTVPIRMSQPLGMPMRKVSSSKTIGR